MKTPIKSASPGPDIKLPIPSKIPFPILLPIPSPFTSKDSRAVFIPPKTFSIAGAKLKPPISLPTLVKFATVLLRSADRVLFKSSFLLIASSVAPRDIFRALPNTEYSLLKSPKAAFKILIWKTPPTNSAT